MQKKAITKHVISIAKFRNLIKKDTKYIQFEVLSIEQITQIFKNATEYEIVDLTSNKYGNVLGYNYQKTVHIFADSENTLIKAPKDSSYMFALDHKKRMAKIKKIDLTGLDFFNIENARGMFASCADKSNSLEIIGLEDKDVSNIKSFDSMFLGTARNATVFKISDISKWNLKAEASLNAMFLATAPNAEWCLDLSNWNINQEQFILLGFLNNIFHIKKPV